MKNESHGNDFSAHLHGENSHEDRLKLLQLQGQDGLVVVGDPGVHGHDHAVRHDRDDDQPLKGGPSHEPNKQPPEITDRVDHGIFGSLQNRMIDPKLL